MNVSLSAGFSLPGYVTLTWDMVDYHSLSFGLFTLHWERPYPYTLRPAAEPLSWGGE